MRYGVLLWVQNLIIPAPKVPLFHGINIFEHSEWQHSTFEMDFHIICYTTILKFGFNYHLFWSQMGCSLVGTKVSAVLLLHKIHQGLYSLIRCHLISIGISIINLRRSSDRLWFIMGIPIPVRRHLLSKLRPRISPNSLNAATISWSSQWLFYFLEWC